MSYDTDAQTYITAVEAADDASLPAYIKNAIDAFVVGAKADGFWTAIKSACFLAGPATLAGALTPLVGAAPTNANFVSGDHNQITGLKGSGSDKHLNTNYNNNADGRNDNHRCVYVTQSGTVGSVAGHMGTSINKTGASNIGYGSTDEVGPFFRNNTSTVSDPFTDNRMGLGIWGTSRSASASFTRRYKQGNATITNASETPESANHLIFWRGSGNYSLARIAWYSAGDSLALEELESRLVTYLAALAAGPTAKIQTRRRRDLGGYGL